MKTMTSVLVAMVLLALSLCTFIDANHTITPTDAKCTMKLTDADDDIYAVYTCFQATFDDVKAIPDEAGWLHLAVSKFPDLRESAFARFSLRGLSFYNCELGHIHPNAFDGLKKLQHLTIYGSGIHVLRGSWFEGMPGLTHLFVDQNDMVYIEPHVFSLIPNLEYLNIEDNNLNCLTRHTLIPLSKLRHARIGKNPWLCTCYTELVEWMRDREIDYGVQNVTESTLECMVDDSRDPSDFETELNVIYENSPASISNYLSISPTRNVFCIGNNISVLSRIPENVQSLKFLNSHLPEIPKYAFFRFGNTLRSLDLSNCSIRDIHAEAFAGLSKLKQLILFNNSINLVRTDWFRDLNGLRYLVMDSNEIEHIESSVFSLLHKLETLSLKKNYVGCFPIRGFAYMKHLKQMIITNNTWICSCLEDFRNWSHRNEANYPVLPTQCTDNKMHMNGKQYISGYRNVTFQHDFENEEKKIINDNAEILALGGTLQDIELFDGNSTEIATHGNGSVKVKQVEACYKQYKKMANYVYHRLLNEEKQKQHRYSPIRAKYDVFERIDEPDVPSEYLNLHNIQHWLLQTTKTSTTKTSIVESSLPGTNKSYISVGGTLRDIDWISLDAEEIKFERSVIAKLFSESFKRRRTLRVLKLLNCGLREIEQHALQGLTNLQELGLDDNEISMVRTSWFEDIPNLQRLSLLRNSISRIEIGAFQLLPNLEYLGISNNQLNCIGIEGLSQLKRLYRMDVGNNPWSCLCQMKLNQWLIERKIQYDEGIFAKKAQWDCIEEYQGVKMNNHNYENINSVTNPKFGDITALMQTIQNSEDAFHTQETEDMIVENSKILHTVVDNTELNSTAMVMQQTVPTPTTSKPKFSAGGCRYRIFDQIESNGWWCNDGDISIFNQIPSSAENIYLHNCDIPSIPINTFVRFPNLTRLVFHNSSIREFEPMALAKIPTLEWLVFVNNRMPIIKSSWFDGLINVTLLGLLRNSVMEIEADVFTHLPNLEQLYIQENYLRCIYTKSLSSLKNLQRVGMQDNPWKWRCQKELAQFFETRNISYQNSESYDMKRVIHELTLDNEQH